MPRRQLITFQDYDPYRPEAAYRMIVRAAELIDGSAALRIALEHLDEDQAGRHVEATLPLPARPNSLATALFAALGFNTGVHNTVAPKDAVGKTVCARFAPSANGAEWGVARFEPDITTVSSDTPT